MQFFVEMRRDRAAAGFSTFDEFLARTANEDRQFLTVEELPLFAPTACGMANGAGGWVVLGAEWLEEEGRAAPRGLRSPDALRDQLAVDCGGGQTFSSALSVTFHVLRDPAPILLARVLPAEWHERPVCIGQDYARGTWRRTEGVGFLSGVGARFRLGLDALERLKDDRPIRGMSPDDLHEESVASFRSAVVRRRPEWSELSLEAFLARAQVLSGGAVTQAGHLMLGRRATRVRAEVRRGNADGEALEVRNLWKAYSDLMPRLTRSLSPACAAAFRECFVNALLHADYDGGDVTVLLRGGPASARFKNPGLMRTQHRGESACRNFRLMKVFQLLGAAWGDGRGLSLIRRYQPDFELQQDALELTTTAVLTLEPLAALQGTPPAARRQAGAAPLTPRPDDRRSQREVPSQEPAPMEAEPAPFLLADPTATAEASTPAHEAVSSRSDEESALSRALVSDPVGLAGEAPTGQGGEAEQWAEETAGGTAAASELRRQTSFGSAADELERAIAEMRGRPEGRRAQDEAERASS